jgi:predicted nucleotidyltransferase
MNEIREQVEQLVKGREGEIEFVVLFGSRARGDWSHGSDYDLLIGLAGDDERRFIDRIGAYTPPATLALDVFPYSRPEWESMARTFHPLLLESLDHGVVLWDRGSYGELQERFRHWMQTGRVQPWRNGWKIADPGGDAGE